MERERIKARRKKRQDHHGKVKIIGTASDGQEFYLLGELSFWVHLWEINLPAWASTVFPVWA